MSSTDDHPTDAVTDRALRQLGTAVVPVEDAERVLARRERLVPGLSAYADHVFTRAPRRSLASTLAVAALAVAALVVVGWRLVRTGDDLAVTPSGATVRASDGRVRIFRAGASATVTDQSPVGLGARDRVETGAGRAEVNLASGAQVELESKSELELGSVDRAGGALSERIDLGAGRIRVRVPKLPPGGSLMIGTPHATVTVHGTAFVVDVRRASDGEPAATTVSVTEGRVSVASGGREIFLGPGTQWTSLGLAPSKPEAKEPAPSGSIDVGRTTPSPANGGRVLVPAQKSTLGEENALFRAAMAARHAGDPRAAVSLLDHLLTTYPASPLGAEARAERQRSLADLASSSTP